MTKAFLLKSFFAIALTAILTSCNQTPKTAQETDGATAEVADTNATTGENAPANTLSEQEKLEGWELLFDGTSLNGWHSFGTQTVGARWKVADGTIMLDPSTPKPEGEVDSDIATANEYGDFELRLEWKIDTCGNSGIIYRATEAPKYKTAWETGPEMQLQDDQCDPARNSEKHNVGDLYDVVVATNKPVKPALEWNEARVVAKGNHVEHWLNGNKILEAELGTDEWKKMVAASKWKAYPDFSLPRQGRIVLQEHGSRVWFRNVKIRKIG
jgi:hypothetical protein